MSFGRHNWLRFLRYYSMLRTHSHGRRFRAYSGRTSAIEVLEDRTLLSNITINDVTAVETSSGTTNFIFTVSRDNNTNLETVDFATADSTATIADSDYSIKSGKLSFAAGGSLSTSVAIAVTGDLKLEVTETFVVNLSNPTGGAVITDSQGLGTITNDDTASLSINNVSVNETNVGAGFLVFDVTLDHQTSAAFTVDFATADSVATLANSDYLAASGTLNFAGTAGEIQTVVVQTVGDTFLEADEILQVNLTNATGGVTISDGQGIGTILNDDNPAPSAPTLTGPASPTSDTTPTITWNAVARADSYEILIYNVDIGQQVVSQTGITTTQFTSPALGQAEHQVFVRAVNAGGNSSYSAPLLFDVVLGTLTITSPGATVGDITPTIKWSTVDGAATYELLVYDISKGREVINATGLTTTEFTPTTNLETTTFQAFVRAIDSFGTKGEYSDAAVFTVMLGTPIIATPGVTTNDTTPTISWSSIEGATAYDLLIYNVLRGRAVVHQTGLTTLQHTTRALEQGTHQAFVRAVNSTNTGQFSEVFFFNVVLGAATLTSPTAVSNDTTPTFVWTEVTGAATYELIVYNVTSGQEVGRLQGIVGTQLTTQTPAGLGSFQVFVRAFDSFGVAGPFSPGLNFQIIASVDSAEHDFENRASKLENVDRTTKFRDVPVEEKDVVVQLANNRFERTEDLPVSMLKELDQVLSEWPHENLWENNAMAYHDLQYFSQLVPEIASSSRPRAKLAAMGTILALGAHKFLMDDSNGKRRRTKQRLR